MSDSENHEVEDPVELMLKRTGCIELHYKVQVSVKIHIISLGKLEKKIMLFSVCYVNIGVCIFVCNL